METHVRVAGWLRIVYSVLALLLVVVGIVWVRCFFGPMMHDLFKAGASASSHEGAPFPPEFEQVQRQMFAGMVPVWTAVYGAVALLQLVGIANGWALLQYRPWARPVNIALSALDLLSIPFGTVLGAYSLWVMLQAETAELFQTGAPLHRYPAHF